MHAPFDIVTLYIVVTVGLATGLYITEDVKLPAGVH